MNISEGGESSNIAHDKEQTTVLEPMHSTACLCPTHSSASPLLCQDLLYNPASQLQQQLTALILISRVINALHPHDSTDHVPVNERAGLLGQCRSLGWGANQVFCIQEDGPVGQKSTQNVNTCGNAGTPCLTQRSSWLAGAALWPSVQRWDDDHPFTSTRHLLPHPVLPGTGLSSSARQNFISFTFPASPKLPPVSKAQLPSYQTSPFIHKLIQ